MNRKKVILLVILVIIIGVVFLVYYINRTEVTPINQVAITKVDKNDKAITIEGCFNNSFDGFAEAKMQTDDENLKLTIYKYSILYRGKRESNFKITINDFPEGIKNIYLMDNGGKKKIFTLE